MRKVTTLALLSILSVSLTSCSDPVIAVRQDRPKNNPAVTVDLLFENDGCKVYRFEDGNAGFGGRTIYYTKCVGPDQSLEKSSALYPESCGKNCTRWVENVSLYGAGDKSGRYPNGK